MTWVSSLFFLLLSSPWEVKTTLFLSSSSVDAVFLFTRRFYLFSLPLELNSCLQKVRHVFKTPYSFSLRSVSWFNLCNGSEEHCLQRSHSYLIPFTTQRKTSNTKLFFLKESKHEKTVPFSEQSLSLISWRPRICWSLHHRKTLVSDEVKGIEFPKIYIYRFLLRRKK